MTNSVNYQCKPNPSYSGVTINIANPMVTTAPMNQPCPPDCRVHSHGYYNNAAQSYVSNPYAQPQMALPYNDSAYVDMNSNTKQLPYSYNGISNSAPNANTQQVPENQMKQLPAYPSQYYLNNYNYIQGADKNSKTMDGNSALVSDPALDDMNSFKPLPYNSDVLADTTAEENLVKSEQIKEDLNARIEAEKEAEKNAKESKVVALTNEYIMSLENFLNDPKKEMRRTAATEVLDRLGEDRSRYDDAALNALLNKMLQDPDEVVRAAALGAFSSQLASGNDFTVTLLSNIQNNPNANTVDVEQAAQSLLKMTTRTEIRYTPVKNNIPQNVSVE